MRNAKEGYSVSRVVCVNCGKDWVAVRQSNVDNRHLECPKCGRRGAEEWQEMEEEDDKAKNP